MTMEHKSMMEAFEFKTKIKDGTIQVPRKYTGGTSSTVKVIILSNQRSKQPDMVEDLLTHPVRVDNFKPLSRDEIYEGI